ncbi:PREDICTED: protein JASON isoform X1 [Lupinus angustifolius]|uniref:protein JASON isoform X1 n=1 Tax=Lupinus angustifolius TaxID=3871 RepID=UPI00092F31CF|nr:PREDICTED: protein JASON isoform X1 [Lupinus angustifolius]
MILGFVLRLLFRSFTKIMSCFFNCFRIRDNRRHLPTSKLISKSSSSPSNDVIITKNSLSSLFQPQKCGDSAGKGNFGVGSQGEGDDQGLRDEAKFLKACGTLAGTPAEIKKSSRKLNVSPFGRDSEPSGFHSWLPSASVEKLQLNVQPFEPPTPIKLCQELGDSTSSLEHTPSSCISNAEDTERESPDCIEGSRTEIIHSANLTAKNAVPISPWPATDTQRKNKSVRFECETDLSSCGKGKSPYPTPLKLFEEMQTPGTVYPASLDDLPNGKHRVRSQFVFPACGPGGNLFQCKILEEKDFDPNQDPSDSVEQSQNETRTQGKGLKTVSKEDEFEEEASLASYLKPASITQEEKNKTMETAYSQTQYFHKTPASDRPIIGVVAAHWNEDDVSHISRPKWWDGNGIPNSTTKYKEDQKVNWHATPFEERLEKALSEGSLISQRKLVSGKQVDFDEIEEGDTALSQMQSSNQAQSVVSF